VEQPSYPFPSSTPDPVEHSYPPFQNSASNPVENHHSEGVTSAAVPVGQADSPACSVGEYLLIIHVFIIAPPFFHDKVDVWNLERLDQRLNAFQTWVLTANGGLLA
jgi:hypothetical protein